MGKILELPPQPGVEALREKLERCRRNEKLHRDRHDLLYAEYISLSAKNYSISAENQELKRQVSQLRQMLNE